MKCLHFFFQKGLTLRFVPVICTIFTFLQFLSDHFDNACNELTLPALLASQRPLFKTVFQHLLALKNTETEFSH